MGIAVKLGIVGFGVLVAVAAYEAYIQPVESPMVANANIAVSRHLAQQVIDNFPANSHWSSLSIKDATPAAYRLSLTYNNGLIGLTEVENDTKAIVKEFVRQLTMADRAPTDAQASIEVTAQQNTAGKAGSTMATLLGMARYDPAGNRIIFEGK